MCAGERPVNGIAARILRRVRATPDGEHTSLTAPPPPSIAVRPERKRSFNEGAHKLGESSPRDRSDREERSEEVRRRFEALADSDRDVIAHAGRAVLVLGALGVVYGDIGTSPLYTEQVIFTSYHATAHVTPRERLRRRLADLLGADDRSSRSSTRASSCAPTTAATAGSWR